MRIGIVIPSVPGYSETFFQNKINGLKENGHDIFLFVNSGKNHNHSKYKIRFAPKLTGNTLIKGFMSLIYLLRLTVTSFKSAYRFWQLEKAEGTAKVEILKLLVINSHILNIKLDWLHFGFTTMGIDRELVGKAIGAQVAVSFRGYDIGVYPIKHPGCYNKLWKHVNLVHTISNNLLNEAYSIGFPKNIQVVKITPAIDLNRFKFQERDFFNSDTIKILTVGRLHWIKGFEYTMYTLSILKKRGFKVNYTIIGSGEQLERLIYAAYQLDLVNEVKFLGALSSEQVASHMKINDLYIQYSLKEGFCNAVLEAQASGMLCIVSDAGGLSENILNEETGWVVPKCNPMLLAVQVLKILKMDTKDLKQIRSRAIERVKFEFSYSKQKAEFESFYKY